MIKAAVYLTGFYVVYRLLLSHDTLYSRNRALILLSIVSAMILPMITIQTNRPLNFTFFGKILSEIFITPGTRSSIEAVSDSGETTLSRWLFMLYIAGVVFFGLKFFIDLFELFFLINRNGKEGSHIIKFHGFNTCGFSAFGHIFINDRLATEESDEIINHEQNHLNHNHSFDIILIESVKIFQWFNPVIHLFSRSLRAVHEYQADEECLNNGTSVNRYQKLLINQVFKSKIFNITNSFCNPSLIKKRIIMMTKRRSKSMANLKMLVILPITALIMVAFSKSSDQNQGDTSSPVSYSEQISPPPPPPPPATSKIPEESAIGEDETEPFVVVQEMPMFPGGEGELLRFLADNTNYPESAKINGTQGKVIVRFAVDAEGNVTRESILKGVDPELDEEALRVVKTLPRFQPGKQDGKPVPVWYMVPINFTLK